MLSTSQIPSSCPLKQQEEADLTNRKRVSKACLECKKRHCRCDHQRPCARCAKLGLDCVDAPTCKRYVTLHTSSSSILTPNITEVHQKEPVIRREREQMRLRVRRSQLHQQQ
jgi:hypothetical protein